MCVQECSTFNLRVFKEGNEVKVFNGVAGKQKSAFDSYFTVKNLHESPDILWASAYDSFSIVHLNEMRVGSKVSNMWEMENGSMLIDPIQCAVMKKPHKIVCLFKVKAENSTKAKKIFVKTLAMEKHKQKMYEMDALIKGLSFVPGIECSSRTNSFFALVIKKKEESVVNCLYFIKIADKGLEVLDEVIVDTYKMSSLFCMRLFIKEKIEYLAVGGNKSCCIFKAKGTKLQKIVDYVNIQSGPIIDISLSMKWIVTGCLKDDFVQVVGVAEENESQMKDLERKSKLVHLFPKLRGDYDSYTVAKIPLKGFGLVGKRFAVSNDEKHLFVVLAKGAVKINLQNPEERSNYLEGIDLCDIMSIDKYLVLQYEKENVVSLVTEDFIEVKRLQGEQLFVHPGLPRYNKHSNSENCYLWMKSAGAVEKIRCSDLDSAPVPGLKVPENLSQVCSAVSSNQNILLYCVSQEGGVTSFVYYDSLKRVFVATKESLLPDLQNQLCMDMSHTGGEALIGGAYSIESKRHGSPVFLVQLGSKFEVLTSINIDEEIGSKEDPKEASKRRRESVRSGSGVAGILNSGRVMNVRRVDFRDMFMCTSVNTIAIVRIDRGFLKRMFVIKNSDIKLSVQDIVVLYSKMYIVYDDVLHVVTFL